MMPTEQEIHAAAESDARFDKRGDLLAMRRAERERYLARAAAALKAAEGVRHAVCKSMRAKR